MNTADTQGQPGGWKPWHAGVILLVLAGFFFVYLLANHQTGNEAESQASGPMTDAQRLAAMNRLRDEDLVIGVAIDNTAKAYALSAIHNPDRHVHNTMQGETPVTITFCNLADCVQVFTLPGTRQPLPVTIVHGASKDKKMVIRVNGQQFDQSTLESTDKSSREFPLKTVPFSRTTWGEWRKLHPDSELFTGNSD